MKLRTRLMIFFIVIILLTVSFLGYFTLQVFKDTFQSYLREEQSLRLEQIVSDLGYIIQKNRLEVSDDDLLLYARSEHIDLEIQDLENRTIAVYDGLEEGPDQESTEYLLIDNLQQPLGSLHIRYTLESPKFMEAADAFYDRSLQAFFLLSLIILCSSFLISLYLSKKLTAPIARLSAMASRIREKDYRPEKENSDIIEIQKLSDNMNYLAKTLEAQEKIRKEYAQDISHELRTPLTNLQLHLEAIQDEMMEPDEKAMTTLLNSTDQLKAIVDRLRESFDDSSLFADPKFENLNLSDELNTILDSFLASAEKKKIDLVRAIEPDINFLTDKRLFRQIISNLVSNAIKAIEEDKEGRIRISMNRVTDEISLSVIDNGVGIDPEDLPRIFDRFYRVDSARNSKQGGKGLGLAITKNIVLLLGGNITVNSRPGKGTNFTILFPGRKK